MYHVKKSDFHPTTNAGTRFIEGYNAYVDHSERGDNPYLGDPANALEWDRGWQDGHNSWLAESHS